MVQKDARKYRLGAALIQSGHLIAFTSKTLIEIETHYANIVQECLLVCFGLEKFHPYLYNRHLIVENDHKPLEMIQCRPSHVATPRLQQKLPHMQKYD